MQALAPFAIGVTIFLCHLVAVPIDGCRCGPCVTWFHYSPVSPRTISRIPLFPMQREPCQKLWDISHSQQLE